MSGPARAADPRAEIPPDATNGQARAPAGGGPAPGRESGGSPTGTTNLAPLPAGAVLVHIGPPKTASTSLQGALYAARPVLAEQGVRHAGRSRHPAAAIQAVVGRRSQFAGGVVPPNRRWQELVREVRRATDPRVVISSELLADAEPDQVRRIVGDLGGSRVHVAVTLRPLASVLPSQWQQLVQDGLETSFDDWLRVVLDRPRSRPALRFWHRHRTDALIARWAEVVGPSRVTAIVLDATDRGRVLRTFEQLLGLHAGSLHAGPDLANRSMTLPEVEAIRAFNQAFRESGLPGPLLARVMHFGAAREMKRRPPPPGARRLALPAWSVARVAELGGRIASGVARSGAQLVGDPRTLAAVPAPRAPQRDEPDHSAGAAAALAMGVLVAGGRVRSVDGDPALDRATDGVPAYVVGGVIAARLWRALSSRRVLDRRRRR
jgi:hypothetical protein